MDRRGEEVVQRVQGRTRAADEAPEAPVPRLQRAALDHEDDRQRVGRDHAAIAVDSRRAAAPRAAGSRSTARSRRSRRRGRRRARARAGVDRARSARRASGPAARGGRAPPTSARSPRRRTRAARARRRTPAPRVRPQVRQDRPLAAHVAWVGSAAAGTGSACAARVVGAGPGATSPGRNARVASVPRRRGAPGGGPPHVDEAPGARWAHGRDAGARDRPTRPRLTRRSSRRCGSCPSASPRTSGRPPG